MQKRNFLEGYEVIRRIKGKAKEPSNKIPWAEGPLTQFDLCP